MKRLLRHLLVILFVLMWIGAVVYPNPRPFIESISRLKHPPVDAQAAATGAAKHPLDVWLAECTAKDESTAGQIACLTEAYKKWISGPYRNAVILPFVSMHGSTLKIISYLSESLAERGVAVDAFDLTTSDIGKIAEALVDAPTLVVGTPTVLGGPHPNVVGAAYLVNMLKPRLKYISVIGSYGWGGKTVDILAGMLESLKAEILPPVLCKGLPQAEDFKALDTLADAIAEKHKTL